MKSIQKKYRSYLLRLWQVQQNEGVSLRASLEDVATGELHGFEDLDALVAFLEQQAFMDQKNDLTLKHQTD